MRSMLSKARQAPLFPFVPVVPLLLGGGMIALEVFMLKRLRRLGQSLDTLLRAQQT